MIEYMLNDEEHKHQKTGAAECVCLITAGENVPGRKDVVAAGVMYFGHGGRVEDMVKALCESALDEKSEPLRRMLMAIWLKLDEKDYQKALLKECMRDINQLLDHDKAGEDEDQDEPVNPEFEELMRDNGIWREEDEDE